MEPVVAGIFPLHPSVIIRILQEFGEVQDAIHVLRLIADPIVYIESGCFVEVAVVAGTLERRGILGRVEPTLPVSQVFWKTTLTVYAKVLLPRKA